jgi:predicted adenylyl cyclase CyaB
MPVETEIKVRLSDLPGFRGRLMDLGAVPLSPGHFEDNHVLDFRDSRLRSRKCLLRVRLVGESAWITFKGPPLPDELFKRRDEWETPVADGPVLLRILTESGMTVWFRYQKRREEYSLDATDGVRSLHIALDITPIGEYAEIEGFEEDILWAASRLGLSKADFIRDSYYYLYIKHCQERGISPGDMVFAGHDLPEQAE